MRKDDGHVCLDFEMGCRCKAKDAMMIRHIFRGDLDSRLCAVGLLQVSSPFNQMKHNEMSGEVTSRYSMRATEKQM